MIMRKRERENPCGICGHCHKYEEGVPCGVCGHRMADISDKSSSIQVSAFASEILLDFLFLGSYDNASRAELLKTQGISRVVNMKPFPEQCENDRARVLVHCMSGRSRSPAIVIAYLMKSKGWKLAQSYQWLKDQRPSIDLNQGVYQQLQEYEQKIFGSLENQPASVMPVVPSPVPSFTFNYAKPSDSVQIPAFNSSVATSISAHPAFAVPPQEFTFGAAHNQRNVLDNLLISNQNSNNTDIAMDG
ncbi:hypothetical protein P3S67_016027 [Capsicum chacoense]